MKDTKEIFPTIIHSSSFSLSQNIWCLKSDFTYKIVSFDIYKTTKQIKYRWKDLFKIFPKVFFASNSIWLKWCCNLKYESSWLRGLFGQLRMIWGTYGKILWFHGFFKIPIFSWNDFYKILLFIIHIWWVWCTHSSCTYKCSTCMVECHEVT